MTDEEFREKCPISSVYYTKEMYEGNEPAGKGHWLLNGEYSDRWQCMYGGGESYKGQILHAQFSLNAKITIYIAGDILNIVDNRYSGDFRVWNYCNRDDSYRVYGCNKSNLHDLEEDKIEKILSTEIDSVFWSMVRDRAKELYLKEK